MAVYNLVSIKNIKKDMENYLFLITSSKSYYIGAAIFSLALLLIISYQTISCIFDLRVFAIVFFFASLFFLSLSQYVYFVVAEKKLSDYKEFFKRFNIDLNNKCEKLMLKHIFSKEKDLDKIKEIFLMNKDLCKNFEEKKKKKK
jgi:hypothetical protein